MCLETQLKLLFDFQHELVYQFIIFQLVIVGVWITSALYSIPKFLFVTTIENELDNNQKETICIAHRKAYNSELFDLINFGLLYVIPLLVMTVSYINHNNSSLHHLHVRTDHISL